MTDESLFSRGLWTLVLTAAVIVVVFSYARHPLLATDGAPVGFAPSLVLWVTGDEANGQASVLAAQAASRFGESGQPTTVGVLHGDSSSAVIDFLSRARQKQLMILSSGTLAGIVRDRSDYLLPEEVREHARTAVRLLSRAKPIAVLAADPLGLAVRAGSPIQTAGQVLSLLHHSPSRPVFDVAADAWLQDNMAELVQAAGLRGAIPYGVFGSSQQAVASLDAGEDGVAVAPRSMFDDQVARGRLRALGWPPSGTSEPRSWIAILSTAGLGADRVSSLRRQAGRLDSSPGWRLLLVKHGLIPAKTAPRALDGFLRVSLGEAARLQALANAVMRERG